MREYPGQKNVAGEQISDRESFIAHQPVWMDHEQWVFELYHGGKLSVPKTGLCNGLCSGLGSGFGSGFGSGLGNYH